MDVSGLICLLQQFHATQYKTIEYIRSSRKVTAHYPQPNISAQPRPPRCKVNRNTKKPCVCKVLFDVLQLRYINTKDKYFLIHIQTLEKQVVNIPVCKVSLSNKYLFAQQIPGNSTLLVILPWRQLSPLQVPLHSWISFYLQNASSQGQMSLPMTQKKNRYKLLHIKVAIGVLLTSKMTKITFAF